MATTREMIYEICVASYPFGITRIDAMNARTQTIVTISSTLAVACAVIASRRDMSSTPYDWALVVVAVAFIKTLAVGLFAMWYGELKALRPANLKNKFMNYEEEKFMDVIISDAGPAMNHNLQVANNKHRLNILAMAFLSVQVIFISFWLVVTYC